MALKSVFFVLAHFCIYTDLKNVDYDDPLFIITTKGPVRGIRLQSESGKDVDAFLGIPYARPPIGKNRFRHPEPADPWTEVFDASKKPNACPHIIDSYKAFEEYASWTPNTPLSEDCLMLNVWVPTPRPQKYAVMVWIHGGGFFMGSSSLDIYDLKIIASEQNIIAVSMNYRLSSLGFLYLGRPNAPGNAGLYDQVLALEWVKSNIASFGGDPKNITIFGQSAGAVSVGFHLLSPISRGLFNRAIMQSGSPNVMWATHDHTVAFQKSLELAEKVNCAYDQSKMPLDAVIECLLTKDPKELTTFVREARVILPFSPVIDGKMVIEDPVKSLKHHRFKQAELLIGSNKEEGSLFMVWNADVFEAREEVYVSPGYFFTALNIINPLKSSLSSAAVAFEYTNWDDPTNWQKYTEALEKISGDAFITCASVHFAHSYAEAGNPVYQYQLGRRFSLNDRAQWIGVPHSEELNFVFGRALNTSGKFPSDEIEFSRRIMAYWANFARTGNPNISPSGKNESVEWPVYSVKRKEYLLLKDNSDKPKQALRARKCAFWNEYLPRLMKLQDRCV